MQSAHWGLWGTILWGAFIAAVFTALQFVTVIAGLIVRVAMNSLSEAEMQEALQASGSDGTLISLSTFVTTVFGCALVALVVKLKKGAVLADYLALQPVPPKPFALWLVALLVFAAAADALTAFIGRPIVPPFMQEAYVSADPVWMLWVAVIVGAPIFEETFFRGFLYKGLSATRLGPFGAVTLVSALWAAIHVQYDLYGISTIFCMGLLIGAARIRTGSLYVPIAMHSLASLIAITEAALLR